MVLKHERMLSRGQAIKITSGGKQLIDNFFIKIGSCGAEDGSAQSSHYILVAAIFCDMEGSLESFLWHRLGQLNAMTSGCSTSNRNLNHNLCYSVTAICDFLLEFHTNLRRVR